MRKFRVVTPPTYYAVTLAEAKLWCKVEDDDAEQDAVLLRLIRALEKFAENLTGRHFVPRTMEMLLPRFPACEIALPFPPVRTVDSIVYMSIEEEWTTLSGSPSNWQESLTDDVAVIAPLYQEAWPAVLTGYLDPVRIRFGTGYASPDKIPALLKQWMQARIGTLFDNRSTIITGTIVAELPRAYVDGLLDDLIVGERMF